MNRSSHAPCAIHFIYCCGALIQINMFITDIKKGADSFKEFRGRILYATVRDNSDELVCSATLEFILRAFFDRQNEVVNYKEALNKYLDFNDEMIRGVS